MSPVVLPDALPLGATIRLWPKHPKSNWCHITSPQGQEFKLKAETNGSVQVWLAEVGEWTYQWTDKDQGTLKVQPLEAPEEPTPMPTRWEFQP